MDCQSFDASLLDTLYDESSSSEAAEEHASGCPSCHARLAQLKHTREVVRTALEVPVPDMLEARILAAAEGAMAARATPAPASSFAEDNVVDLAARRAARASGETEEPKAADARAAAGAPRSILRYLPQLAVAAGFFLVLGAAALVLPTIASKREPPAAARAESAPSASGGALAFGAAAEEATPAPVATAAAPIVAAASGAPAPPSKAKGFSGPGDDEAKHGGDLGFVQAKALADGGKCREALPKLEAIAKTSAGTETGSRASLEAARCYKIQGQLAAARSRYQNLKTDNYVAQEANAELASIESAPKATTVRAAAKPASPAATATATTRAVDVDNAYK
jgi:hypothetical protein